MRRPRRRYRARRMTDHCKVWMVKPTNDTQAGGAMKTLNTLRGFALLAGLLAAAAGWTQQKPQNTALAKATVAAGCFWCVEEAFDPVPGVVSTTSGYMGGQRRNPT